MKKNITLSLILILLFASFYFSNQAISKKLLGMKPTKTVASAMPEPKLTPDEKLDPLRAIAKNEDASVRQLSNLCTALQEKYEESGDQNLLLELIQTLARITKIDPKNAKALLTLAEITFDKQVFDKSALYYEEYLKIEPSDYESRARYASTLIFLNRSKDALIELDAALEDKPDYFQALAFKAIALSDSGNIPAAKDLADKAILNAPTEEAKKRLKLFFESHAAKNNSEIAKNNQTNKTDEDSLINFFNNHPILSPKISDIQSNKNVLEVYLENFPLEAMPEFAKKSLMEKIKTSLNESAYQEVSLKDSASKKELINLKK